MKFGLILFLCSFVAEECLPPHYFPAQFEDEYTCLMTGYEQSILKLKEIGREEINEHSMYIRFVCAEIKPSEEDT